MILSEAARLPSRMLQSRALVCRPRMLQLRGLAFLMFLPLLDDRNRACGTAAIQMIQSRGPPSSLYRPASHFPVRGAWPSPLAVLSFDAASPSCSAQLTFSGLLSPYLTLLSWASSPPRLMLLFWSWCSCQ